MLDRNRYMVDHAGTLLAVYNGEHRNGTAATVRYAQKLDRKIIIIEPTTGKISRDKWQNEHARLRDCKERSYCRKMGTLAMARK